MRAAFLSAWLVFSAVFLSACNDKAAPVAPVVAAQPAIDQVTLCETNEWQHGDAAQKCKVGQKVVFLPRSFGNEQLPILFAAVNCDLRYTVALTTGAVTCIYGPITPKPAEPPKEEEKAK